MQLIKKSLAQSSAAMQQSSKFNFYNQRNEEDDSAFLFKTVVIKLVTGVESTGIVDHRTE